jgi:glycerophosphoryl diester phosphodiesterase
LPQNIGHRGYKAAFPENTMAAFHGAVVAGAHALETDLHLSRDGVVVLSHVSIPCKQQTLDGPLYPFWCTSTE